MIIDFESENMAWRFYLQLEWTCFYITLVIAGVGIEFHITNLRDLVYPKPSDKPFCAENCDCKNCDIEIDCGGQGLRLSASTARNQDV